MRIAPNSPAIILCLSIYFSAYYSNHTKCIPASELWQWPFFLPWIDLQIFSRLTLSLPSVLCSLLTSTEACLDSLMILYKITLYPNTSNPYPCSIFLHCPLKSMPDVTVLLFHENGNYTKARSIWWTSDTLIRSMLTTLTWITFFSWEGDWSFHRKNNIKDGYNIDQGPNPNF